MELNTLLTQLGNHSISELPREACGIITKQFEYFPSKNISNSPTNSFIINPVDIIKHEGNIWGFFHSHPYVKDPIPSKADLSSTVFSQYKFIVGFANNFYIYWVDSDTLRFEQFNENHCTI